MIRNKFEKKKTKTKTKTKKHIKATNIVTNLTNLQKVYD